MSGAAVARLLQVIGDNECASDGSVLAIPAKDHVVLHPALVAQLTESEASGLGLPPVARLALNLQSIGVAHQTNFRIETRWTKANGLPAPVKLSGARLKFEAKEWRIADPIWTTLQLVERLNAADGDSERQSALAALRQAIGDEDRSLIKPDGFIERLRLSYAAGFSLDLKPSSSGFDFDPVLFSPGRDNVSTPQMILNGRTAIVGSRQREVDAAIVRAGRIAGGPAILINGDIVEIGAGKSVAPATLWLVRYDPRGIPVPIRAGENGGRTIIHRNIVRQLTMLGHWSGQTAHYTLPRYAGSLRSALILQAGRAGPMLAARRI